MAVNISHLSELNQGVYLQAIGAVRDTMESISKIKPETTRDLKAIFGSIERMTRTSGALGPIRNALQMPGRQFGLQIGNSIQAALMPMTLQLNQLINQATNLFLPFIQENATGAVWGGTIGFIAGFILPGSPTLWALVGAFAGAGIESGIPPGDIPEDQYTGGGAGWLPPGGRGDGSGTPMAPTRSVFAGVDAWGAVGGHRVWDDRAFTSPSAPYIPGPRRRGSGRRR